MFTVDADGQIADGITFGLDFSPPSSRPAYIGSFVVDEPNRRLYASLNYEAGTDALPDRSVAMWSLDARGIPVGPAQTFGLGLTSPSSRAVGPLVMHPSRPLLYIPAMHSNFSAHVAVISLESDGLPLRTGDAVADSSRKWFSSPAINFATTIALSPGSVPPLLYLGDVYQRYTVVRLNTSDSMDGGLGVPVRQGPAYAPDYHAIGGIGVCWNGGSTCAGNSANESLRLLVSSDGTWDYLYHQPSRPSMNSPVPQFVNGDVADPIRRVRVDRSTGVALPAEDVISGASAIQGSAIVTQPGSTAIVWAADSTTQVAGQPPRADGVVVRTGVVSAGSASPVVSGSDVDAADDVFVSAAATAADGTPVFVTDRRSLAIRSIVRQPETWVRITPIEVRIRSGSRSGPLVTPANLHIAAPFAVQGETLQPVFSTTMGPVSSVITIPVCSTSVTASCRSPWFRVNPAFLAGTGSKQLRLSFASSAEYLVERLNYVRLRYEVANGDPTDSANPGDIQQQFEQISSTNTSLMDTNRQLMATAIRLAGSSERPAQQVALTHSETEHANRLTRMLSPGLACEALRPRLYSVSCGSMVGPQDPSLEQLAAHAQVVSGLGCNTVDVHNWSLPDSWMRETLGRFGLTTRTAAGGPGGDDLPANSLKNSVMFDFSYRRAGIPMFPSQWTHPAEAGAQFCNADDAALPSGPAGFRDVCKTGGTLAQISTYALWDEPSWRVRECLTTQLVSGECGPEGGAVITQVTPESEYQSEFQQYLARPELALSPSMFGASNYSSIAPREVPPSVGEPVVEGPGSNLPERMRYYWTMKYLHQSWLNASAEYAAALRSYSSSSEMAVFNNFNNDGDMMFRSLVGSNSGVYARTTIAGDWFEFARSSGVTPWSEDAIVGEIGIDEWRWRGDLLRSVALEQSSAGGRPAPFGGYFQSGNFSMRQGASYRLLSMIGRGAKYPFFYTYGPGPTFADGFSDRAQSYDPIAIANHRLGQIERLTSVAVPERGSVAVYHPSRSVMWDTFNSGTRYYSNEMRQLHLALADSGIRVDFVDDGAILNGALHSRGYKALFLLGPNVSGAAQSAIATWVGTQQGTLVALPGAGVANEYNSRTLVIDDLLGVQARPSSRGEFSMGSSSYPLLATVNVAPSLGGSPLAVRGVGAALQPISGVNVNRLAAVGDLATGAPWLLERTEGLNGGRAIAFGFYPGFNYGSRLERDSRGLALPTGWDDRFRTMLSALIPEARAQRTVRTDTPRVEILRMDTEDAIVLILLNWNSVGIPCLDVDLDIRHSGPTSFRKITATDEQVHEFSISGDQLRFTVPLSSVNVVMIERV